MTATTSIPGLHAEGVTVRFGGLVAVDDVTLDAQPGRITAIIGPNGAGKTTFFNACAGVVRTSHGSVRLGGTCLDRHSPSARAQLGVGRTFQRTALMNSMTVRENVAMGPEAMRAGNLPWRQLWVSPSTRRTHLANADETLERCGIAAIGGVLVGELSTGQRRFVELARVLATSFRFLLLDEPSSGLDVEETRAFGAILRDTVQDRGIGLLLVEHDMALVRSVCDYVYVLDFGSLVHHAPVADALASDVVRDVYLGAGVG